MKIRAIHTQDGGPIGTQVFDLKDSWTDAIAARVLLSGPNGTGKSWMLRAIATLWGAFGEWLHTRKVVPARHGDLEWLRQWGGFALVIEQTGFGDSPLVLVYGSKDFVDNLEQRYPDHACVGERVSRSDNGRSLIRTLILRTLVWKPQGLALDRWAESRHRMLVSAIEGGSANLVFLDAEERRWVKPRRGLGEIKPEDLGQRWLATYRPSEQWEGQLESSLLAMKAAEPGRFSDMIRDMNGFLSGKRILTEIVLGDNRLQVVLDGRPGKVHGLDDLSAGEHQVLIQLYMVGRWLAPGGIVLIDEPDLHLHPSLIPGFLAQLERMVEQRHGQLFLTSHLPDIWNRYEALGQRILLEAQA